MLRHQVNCGYGAAQKTGYTAALNWGAEGVALIHGDAQYAPETILDAAKYLPQNGVLLGSRFLQHHATGMPQWRKWGNRALTSLANRRFQCRFSDLHTGARVYHRRVLEQCGYQHFSPGFLFDQELLVWAMGHQIPMVEFPIPPCYSHGVQSISPINAARYAMGCLRLISPLRNPTVDPKIPPIR